MMCPNCTSELPPSGPTCPYCGNNVAPLRAADAKLGMTLLLAGICALALAAICTIPCFWLFGVWGGAILFVLALIAILTLASITTQELSGEHH